MKAPQLINIHISNMNRGLNNQPLKVYSFQFYDIDMTEISKSNGIFVILGFSNFLKIE